MRQTDQTAKPCQTSSLDSGLNFLFLSAFPLLLWVFQGSFSGVATAILQIWIFAIALRLISRGHKIQAAYDAAVEAERPKLPRKLLGSALIAVVVTVLAGHHYVAIWVPMIAGLCAFGLSVSSFGIDPLKDKVAKETTKAAQKLQMIAETIETIDAALDTIADRVATLEDADMTRRTDAAQEAVMRVMRNADHEALPRIIKPIKKFTKLLAIEADRLLAENGNQSFEFARQRYAAKLSLMTESFENHAAKTGKRGARDAFDRQADLLLDRMPQESAA